MPQCSQLIPKGTNTPEKLSLIDDKICEHLGETPDPVKYAHHWFDIIGFKFALGKRFEEVRADFAENVKESPQYADEYATLGKILDFIEANYEVNSFYEHK